MYPKRFLTDIRKGNVEGRTQQELQWQIQNTQHLEGLKILAGAVMHDLNNLLTTIIGNTDIILHYPAEEQQIPMNLRRIMEAARTASKLTYQMLSYVGKDDMVFDTLNLKSIIIETERMLRLTPEKRSILQFDLDDIPVMNADVSQIIRLVMNMMINATDMPPLNRGKIGIFLKCQHMTNDELDKLYDKTGSQEGEYILLKVLDMGYGLDRETLLNMFGPFKQMEFPGKGLGMATALELVTNPHGVISIKFEQDGERSITAIFPQASSICGTLNSTEPVQVERMPGRTILLVDDIKSVLVTTAEMLEGLGHSVITARNGFEALEVFNSEEREIDCVILDLTMPEMDGATTFSLLRALKPDVPVILSSGYNRAEAFRYFGSKGFDGFLQKPYDLVILRSALEEVNKILD